MHLPSPATDMGKNGYTVIGLQQAVLYAHIIVDHHKDLVLLNRQLGKPLLDVIQHIDDPHVIQQRHFDTLDLGQCSLKTGKLN